MHNPFNKANKLTFNIYIQHVLSSTSTTCNFFNFEKDSNVQFKKIEVASIFMNILYLVKVHMWIKYFKTS